jgi:hypothetical protein
MAEVRQGPDDIHDAENIHLKLLRDFLARSGFKKAEEPEAGVVDDSVNCSVSGDAGEFGFSGGTPHEATTFQPLPIPEEARDQDGFFRYFSWSEEVMLEP